MASYNDTRKQKIAKVGMTAVSIQKISLSV
jgi:hypothetical protein